MLGKRTARHTDARHMNYTHSAGDQNEDIACGKDHLGPHTGKLVCQCNRTEIMEEGIVIYATTTDEESYVDAKRK